VAAAERQTRRKRLLSISGLDAAVRRVAEAMTRVSRSLANEHPRSLGMPFFLLDSGVAYDLQVLDSISNPGIFRKYELALEVGCGLGGRTRWLAARTGCKVVGIEPELALVAGAETLNRATCFQEQVSFATADPQRIGLASETFTHVWMLDVEPGNLVADIIGESLRVLRKGGHIFVQSRYDCPRTVDTLTRSLSRWGVVELAVRIEKLPALPAHSIHARHRLRLELERSWPDAHVCDLLWDPSQLDDRVVQFSGRRPL